MPRSRHLLILAPAFLLVGCSLMPPAEDDPVLVKLNELERRLAGIERVVQNQGLVNLSQQVISNERRGDALQGQIEELSHEATTTADRQRQLYIDLDARMQQLEASVVGGRDTRRRIVDARENLPVPGGSARDNYQAAFELLKSEQYEPAGLAFEQFLVAFPDSGLADNAQYWLAEAHYVTQAFDRALQEFEAVIETYPDSSKVPDALLKIGYCNYELRQWDAARGFLARVQSDYPETTAAMLAGQRLQRMQEEGV